MANLDRIFHCLSDATRRAVVARLTLGPASVGALAAAHDMALPSFLKHLRVLEDGELIETRKEGRVRVCRLRPETARAAEDWLGRQRLMWEERFDRLDALLEDTKGRDA